MSLLLTLASYKQFALEVERYLDRLSSATKLEFDIFVIARLLNDLKRVDKEWGKIDYSSFEPVGPGYIKEIDFSESLISFTCPCGEGVYVNDEIEECACGRAYRLGWLEVREPVRI